MNEQPVAPTPPNTPAVPPPDPAPMPATPAPMPPATETTLPNVPEEWPGAWGLYKYSKQAVRRNVGTLLILYILSFLVGGVLGFAGGNIGGIVGDLLSVVFTIAVVTTELASVRGQKVSFGQAFKRFSLGLYWRLIVNSFLVTLITIVSFLLLIVPFFIVLPRLVLAPYFVVDRQLGPIAAIKASWALTKGFSGSIWGIFGATAAMGLLFITIIGIPFSLYFLLMYSAATALLYEYLHKNQNQPVQQVATAPVAPVGPTPPAPTAA